ncbi:MAG: 50S ribosomal protein L11 methyltransferase [Finegoldia magna]|uniref:Ribosomal protein L11 methyltransferase n=1 Tax=Finegoldia magna TaxID=1260 RepID=A0A233W1R8_FINMA|nr:50S ribosomal protein L11 methyltransferase [Finegoldia magna]EFK93678.1 ribosomal protein L11 methyltransferase [Finegoldia magna ACS-171-V-Col3]EXF26884.1 ribosomal protein L11 methyltransferase [Finegoldia magna ALB8]MDU5525992.1 50S ribosomal protein L11 methyltransferase [Finegoldia magna]MSB16710.1 50S ribosomal protein L11 methyltransferase [Finegoldia magna]MSD45516.1 50S ribosomal protein L11 methyltransferase [Finegoldia magna]
MEKWLSFDIKCPKGYDEIISSILYDLGIENLQIDDYQDVIDFKKNQPYWVVIDDEEFTPHDNVIIKAFYEDDKVNYDEIEAQIKEFSINNNIDIQISKNKEIEDMDWANEWKKYYEPFYIGNILIKPSWIDIDESDHKVVEINPGMAFGTGLHETTNLCIEQLQELNLIDKIVLDIGCGSGILSVVSSKLGAKEVFATDIDPLAIEATLENANLNKISNINAVKGSLLDNVDKKYDVVVANILLNVLDILIPDLPKALKKDGVFICSGLINSQKDNIVNTLEKNNLEIVEVSEKGEWISIISRFKNV